MTDFSKRICYRVPDMSECAVVRDRIYKSADGKSLTMDVYSPARAADKPLPIILFIHGGPIPSDMTPPTRWGIFQSYGELAAASGFVGVTFNHRLFGQSDYDRSQSDVLDALKHLREHASEFRSDSERIALWVFSGGGTHLSWVLREQPRGLRCAVAFYPILDARPFLPANADAAASAAVEKLSAVCQIRKGHSLPIFIARAGLDSPQLNTGTDGFVAAALTANMMVNISNHAAGRHGFDYLNDDARTRELIGGAVEFVKSHTQCFVAFAQ